MRACTFDDRAARQLRLTDPKRWTYQALATEFGVSEGAINGMLNRKRKAPKPQAKPAAGPTVATLCQCRYPLDFSGEDRCFRCGSDLEGRAA
jgi:hypothetical protein